MVIYRRVMIGTLAILGLNSSAYLADSADSNHTDIGDGPVVATHVSEADCESGKLLLDEMIERGRQLFVAKFNSFDGQWSCLE